MRDTTEKSTELHQGPDRSSLPVHVGLDVHKESIVAAVASWRPGGLAISVEDFGQIRNTPSAVSRLVGRLTRKFGPQLHFVYEAGPCGYALLRRLRGMDLRCDLVAPTQIPKKPGDRVKTDRRDARKLAQLSAVGSLEPLWIPDRGQEAMRDLVRFRADLKVTIRRHRQQTQHFVLRQDRRFGGSTWTEKHRAWLKDLKFEHSAHQAMLHGMVDTLGDLERQLESTERDIERELPDWPLQPLVHSLRALRGIDRLAAVTLLAEIGDLRRFPTAPQFMGYLGLTSSEWSSAEQRRRGAITKTGNGAVRRLLTESAWTYRYPARETRHLQRKASEASEYARQRAWAAQKRLCHRYSRMIRQGKDSKLVVTAIARELAAYIWDIACHDMPPMADAT